MKKTFLLVLCLLCLLAMSVCAHAEDDWWWIDGEHSVESSPVTAYLFADEKEIAVKANVINEDTWLFLPAFAQMEELTVEVNGSPASLEDIGEEEEGIFSASLVMNGEEQNTIYLMQSENLRTVFLSSSDPVNQGRDYIENCEGKHTTRTTGSLMIVNAQAGIDYEGDLKQIRGRGNYSWTMQKKPYQLKLEKKADLLCTGDEDEANRTWNLLADTFDATMLKNRMVLDIGLELGMTETSRSEHIDLYYDGEYRGLYLLCEKVEIGKGRIDEVDYEKLVEKWNAKAGINDLDELPVATAVNRYGTEFTFIDGLTEMPDVSVGAILIEQENIQGTLSDPCYFTMEGDYGLAYAIKNPEHTSEAVMRYASERLTEARQTLIDGGVNKQTGRTLWEDFDVDAFARMMLVGEWSYNPDSYNYSSSWFVLPAGDKQIRPGTLWDFDLAFPYLENGGNQKAIGTKADHGWTADFYNCPEFLSEMLKIWENEFYPMIQEILLGQEDGEYLKSIDSYCEEIAASLRMNGALWKTEPSRKYELQDRTRAVQALKRFITERTEWMNRALHDAVSQQETITLWGNAGYLNVENTVNVSACLWDKAVVEKKTWEQLTQADEEGYAIWQLELILAPMEGYAFGEPTITLNGTPLSYEKLEDGKLRLLCTFPDLSYRPVDYYGEDVGYIFIPELYRENYPDISEEYEDDNDLMDYFFDEGVYEGQRGNGFFDPFHVLWLKPEIERNLGTSWSNYYSDFLAYGLDEGWMLDTSRGFALIVEDAL